MVKKQPFSITQNSKKRIKYLLSQADENVIGIKFSVSEGGCAAMSYKVDYAKEITEGDEVIDIDNFKVIIDSASIMYLLGLEIDYVEDKLSSKFTFNNPNAVNHCGCGESFSV